MPGPGVARHACGEVVNTTGPQNGTAVEKEPQPRPAGERGANSDVASAGEAEVVRRFDDADAFKRTSQPVRGAIARPVVHDENLGRRCSRGLQRAYRQLRRLWPSIVETDAEEACPSRGLPPVHSSGFGPVH